jgi:hypothetical protein
MGQPGDTNTGLDTMPSKKLASAAQSKNIRGCRADSVATDDSGQRFLPVHVSGTPLFDEPEFKK